MSSDLLKLPIFLYVAVKTGITRLKLIKCTCNLLILISLSIIISALLLVPIILLMVVFAFYRALINLYLQKLHKESYRGIMEGIDAICCHQTNCVPALLCFVEFSGSLEELKQEVIKQIQRVMATKLPKLFYSRGEFMGYHYYFTEDIPAANYVTVIDTNETIIDKKQISKIFMSHNMSPMPYNDSKLLQVVICPQPVDLEEYRDAKVYCVMYRMHHCVGDGNALLHLVSACFADNNGKAILQSDSCKNEEKSKIAIRKIMRDTSIKEIPFMAYDRNQLRASTLTEDKHITWFSDQGKTSIDKIRSIKKNINGATFLDVMNTCLTLSLCDYYKKRALRIPNNIIGGLVLSTNNSILVPHGSMDFELSNRISVAAFRLPIDIDFNGDNKIMATLNYLKTEYEDSRRSLDIHFNYYCTQNISNFIPSQIMRLVSKFIEITIGISSLPGFDEITFYGGNKVRDVISFLPNSPGTGLHIIFHTYKGHLRIGFTADKSVMYKYEYAQEIVDGIVVYLDELNILCSKSDTSI